MSNVVFDPRLTKADVLVLRSLAAGCGAELPEKQQLAKNDLKRRVNSSHEPDGDEIRKNSATQDLDDAAIGALAGLNDPADPRFEPTVFNGTDLDELKLPPVLDAWLLRPYIRMARSIVRVDTDVVMLTHLLLYFSTSVPSAAFLFWRFSWVHAIIHLLMQGSYMGAYTLLMHQHIHMRGVLEKRFFVFDSLFPYVLDPLMGHTWNSYFYHHVKHHHVEGNGPDDLSSTIRYQRDNIYHFLHYVGRFLVLVWLDLPLYFMRKGRTVLALKTAFWELSSYAVQIMLFRLNPRATFIVLILPFTLLRFALMVGNWGQHAFVDHDEPASDYRSSITLIDVAVRLPYRDLFTDLEADFLLQSNRHSFNDGYHTSHHLNPLRHWREHPLSFMKGKDLYASQQALVFHNIDYIMITVRLLAKDYLTLAKCMVPIGTQVTTTMEERVALLKSHTRQFTEEEISAKFGNATK
ncbi:hypothetical protein ACHAQA_002287 [Verticillium albo-atrum]